MNEHSKVLREVKEKHKAGKKEMGNSRYRPRKGVKQWNTKKSF